jgi:hypothetical protein
MNVMWSLINNLELVVHLPLFSIAFPSNAFEFLNKLIEIMTYDVIPIDKYMDKIFPFIPSS